MTTFFTSDLHLGHGNIIKYCNRPFSNAEEMTETIIERWNKKVRPTDIVYDLGDVIFHSDPKIIARLNGRKTLILGNHDRESQIKYYYENVYRISECRELDTIFILCHYPFESWNRQFHGSIHLHGHTHGTLDHKIKNRIDVGIDCHPNYEPFSIDEVLERVKQHNDSIESRSN